MKIIFQNLANLITSIGIVLTIWLNCLIWNNPINHLLVFFLAVGIGVSDLLDGWVARNYQAATSLGGFLDKFRDKFFTCSIFTYFLKELWQWYDGIWLALVKGLVILILAIELFLITVWFIGFIKRFDISSHLAGKIKTAFYFVAITWWFFIECLEKILQRNLESYFFLILIFLLLFASLQGILSVVGYLWRYNHS